MTPTDAINAMTSTTNRVQVTKCFQSIRAKVQVYEISRDPRLLEEVVRLCDVGEAKAGEMREEQQT